MSEILYGLGGLGLGLAAPHLAKWLPGGRGGRRLVDELRGYFGSNPAALPIVSCGFASLDLPNVHLAVRAMGESRAIGYTSMMSALNNGLREMISGESFFGIGGVKVGPVQYRHFDIDVDEQVECVENGILLLQFHGRKVAAHIRTDLLRGGQLEVEVMAETQETGSSFIEAVRDRVHHASVYRGKILSLEAPDPVPGQRCGATGVRFHRFPNVDADEIILPEETLRLVARNTGRFFEHTAQLRRAGRSVKRGLLFHGKPGTGKTYTAKWLAGSLEGITVILMSGEQLALVTECCRLARALAPSLVIMEDVDLIATQRDENRNPFYQITLHKLLNEMDGLDADSEVVFILTTNRPDVLEPALAARPGRIDQAIGFPLPDATCRHRLLQLYGRGLALELQDADGLVRKTEGASPAFYKELLRKAAVAAAEAGSETDGKLRVTDVHCEEALRDMIMGGGELTRQLLGFAEQPPPPRRRRPPAAGT